MKVIGFGCGPWRWYRGVGKIHMNKGRVGEERGGKETDGCPLTRQVIQTLSNIYVQKLITHATSKTHTDASQAILMLSSIYTLKS
jgi:hypothetical protein